MVEGLRFKPSRKQTLNISKVHYFYLRGANCRCRRQSVRGTSEPEQLWDGPKQFGEYLRLLFTVTEGFCIPRVLDPPSALCTS